MPLHTGTGFRSRYRHPFEARSSYCGSFPPSRSPQNIQRSIPPPLAHPPGCALCRKASDRSQRSTHPWQNDKLSLRESEPPAAPAPWAGRKDSPWRSQPTQQGVFLPRSGYRPAFLLKTDPRTLLCRKSIVHCHPNKPAAPCHPDR